MAKDNRTSNMPESTYLYSDSAMSPFPYSASMSLSGNADSDALLLISRSGSHNEKIKYKNFKRSVLDNVVFLTGDQLISGEKTFADVCTFLSRTNINEIIDITETGDISGNVFVGESGLFQKVGVGLHFTRREMVDEIQYNRPSGSGDFNSRSYGGGVYSGSYTNATDFISGEIDLTTEALSFNVYQPSGFYAAMIPESQQNNTDTSLDGHNLSPDELHYEMGGAWLGIEFDKPFYYRGIEIYHSDLDTAPEDFKVVASNNGTDWKTIHTQLNLSTGDYAPVNSGTRFELSQYSSYPYSHYRLVPTKIINSDQWKLKHFNIVGIKKFPAPFRVDPTHTLHVSGNSLFVGDVEISGNTFVTGNNRVIGDSFFLGNIDQTGDFTQFGDNTRFGNSYLSGYLSVTGDVDIHGDLMVTGDIGLNEYLYHNEDEDTFLRFTDDQITLSAGSGAQIIIKETGEADYISFTTSGVERARIVNDGKFAINNTTPMGELSLTGDAYLERLYVTGEDGSWERVFGGSDEAIAFFTRLYGGKDSYQINFPKTFSEAPSLALSLQNDKGAPIVPFSISGVSQTEYFINFASHLNGHDYVVNTTARPRGDFAANKTTIQSFTTGINAGKDTYEIIFPETFHVPPIVSAVAEADSVFIPYIISGVTRSGYSLLFGTNLPSNYKIHTHAVR